MHNCGVYLLTWGLLDQKAFETSIREHAPAPKTDRSSTHSVCRGSSEESAPFVESTAGLESQAPTWYAMCTTPRRTTAQMASSHGLPKTGGCWSPIATCSDALTPKSPSSTTRCTTTIRKTHLLLTEKLPERYTRNEQPRGLYDYCHLDQYAHAQEIWDLGSLGSLSQKKIGAKDLLGYSCTVLGLLAAHNHRPFYVESFSWCTSLVRNLYVHFAFYCLAAPSWLLQCRNTLSTCEKRHLCLLKSTLMDE